MNEIIHISSDFERKAISEIKDDCKSRLFNWQLILGLSIYDCTSGAKVLYNEHGEFVYRFSYRLRWHFSLVSCLSRSADIFLYLHFLYIRISLFKIFRWHQKRVNHEIFISFFRNRSCLKNVNLNLSFN